MEEIKDRWDKAIGGEYYFAVIDVPKGMKVHGCSVDCINGKFHLRITKGDGK